MFNKLKEQLKVMFEGNRCRFRKECKHYQLGSTICNNWYERFPTDGSSYCGTYRELDNV